MATKPLFRIRREWECAWANVKKVSAFVKSGGDAASLRDLNRQSPQSFARHDLAASFRSRLPILPRSPSARGIVLDGRRAASRPVRGRMCAAAEALSLCIQAAARDSHRSADGGADLRVEDGFFPPCA